MSMKRIYYFGIGFGILILGTILFFFSLYKKLPPNSPPVSQPIATATPVKLLIDETIKEDSLEGKYSIEVIYPQITALDDNQKQTSINESITALMKKNVATFKKAVAKLTPPPELTTGKSIYQITYEVSEVDNSRVSIHFKIMESLPGMAHPANTNQVYNFDMQTGKELTLKNLFREDSNYLIVLSDIAKKDLLDQQRDDPNAFDVVTSGASPKASNFSLFLLTPKNLILLFNPATVAPDYVGTMKITIPLEELQEIFETRESLTP